MYKGILASRNIGFKECTYKGYWLQGMQIQGILASRDAHIQGMLASRGGYSRDDIFI